MQVKLLTAEVAENGREGRGEKRKGGRGSVRLLHSGPMNLGRRTAEGGCPHMVPNRAMTLGGPRGMFSHGSCKVVGRGVCELNREASS
jgi:hypothetical protein